MLFIKIYLLLNSVVLGIPASLIVDFMRHKNLNNLVIYDCNNAKDLVHLRKILRIHNIRSTFRISERESSCRITPLPRCGVVLNTNCEKWTSVVECFYSNINFSNFFSLLIVTTNLSTTKHMLSVYPIEFNSDVNIACLKDNTYDIYEVYNTGFYSKGVFISNNVGYWNLTLTLKKSIRKDLFGVVLQCALVITENVSESLSYFLTNLDPARGDNLNRYKYYTLLTYLEQMLNLRLQVIQFNSWGYVYNGSFDGLVGALQRGYAEIGGSPVFFRKDRADVTDYVAEVWEAKVSFIFRHPKLLGGLYTIYTRPFAATVWFCVLAMIVILAISLSIMLKLKILKVSTEENDVSISLALLWVWGALCQQGMTVSRKSISIKLLIFVTFVLFLTISQHYNAIVVSTLLRETSKNIRTLEDLTSSNLKAGVENILYLEDFFKHTKDPVAKELYRKKIATKYHYNFLEPHNGMRLVKQGGFAYHVDSSLAYRIMRETFTEREICDIQEVSMFQTLKMGILLKKNSPYKDLFAHGIRKIFEAGLAHRLKSVWDEPRPACVRTRDSSIFSVSIMEVSSVLLVLLIGYGLAVVILFIEIVMYKTTKKVKTQKIRWYILRYIFGYCDVLE
nr:ionotropic receptor 64a [Achelura yunnanensis]